MTTDLSHEPEDPSSLAGEPFAEERRGDGRFFSGCLTGCLVALGIGVLLVALAVFWISRNWREWVGGVATQAIEGAIEATELPAQEKAELMEEVRRVAEAFQEGRLSGEQAERIVDALIRSPLIGVLAVSAAEGIYISPSGLSDEEKQQARITLQRFLRGLLDEDIDQQAFDSVMAHIADRQPDGEWRLRQQVSDDELRAFIAAAKDEADQAGVPEEIEEVDPSDELRRIIDEAMAPAEVMEPTEAMPAAEATAPVEEETPPEAMPPAEATAPAEPAAP